MASRLAQIAEGLVEGLTKDKTATEAATPALPVAAVDKSGAVIAADALKEAIGAAAPGAPLGIDFAQLVAAKTDLGPLSGAIFRGLAAAIPGLLLLPSMAQVTGEVPFMRPLRKHFSPAMLSGLEIIDAYRRGAFDLPTAKTKLAESGLSDEDQTALFMVTKYLPQPQDVIRFAVREVYSPDIAAKFGQFEEVDKVIGSAGKDLAAVGIDEDTLRKFWAAHWELPSISQGFEMFHRGIIDEATLDVLLRALDVMPYWREKLKAMAYNPLTRVDIRRMFKLGVLDKAGVEKSYKDLGYSPENAKLLLEFTIKSIANPEAGEETLSDRAAARQKDLSVSDLMTGLDEGILKPEDVTKALAGLGYAKGEAAFLVQQRQLEARLARAKDNVKALGVGFLGGVFSETQVSQEMSKLGFPADEIKVRLDAWKLDQESRVVMPTKADFLRWLKSGRITKEEAVDGLKREGVPQKFIELYVDEHLPSGTATA